MGRRLQKQFGPIRIRGGDHGDLRVFAHRHVVLDFKAEDLGVELKCRFLIIDEKTCDGYSHRVSSTKIPHQLEPSSWELHACDRGYDWVSRIPH